MRTTGCLLPLLLSALLMPSLHVAARASQLVMLVDRAADLPFAEFQGDQVRAGIQLQLGQMLAARLGMPLEVRAVPRKRIAQLLDAGHADLACALLPEWLEAAVDWTQPFLPHAGVVITPQVQPRPGGLDALAGQPIGTIKGYAYRELEQALGRGFVREDAPDSRTLLRMLELGRMKHASVNLQYLEYQRKLGIYKQALHPYLQTGAYETRCALSKRSALKVTRVDELISGLRSDGSLKRLLDQYRD
ncbi:transporter substrate-binding domain-containing protein [Pelomonas sp. SE-A7]|uniref:substrate-binding periplasmic protein n=1 Tax=Pelomonas sp. SE-A7 TaxID=3054953 RepID=UPI00259D0B69|nr:transporter substrate-binding domain-containing protein [Pelomonas sp. SE-A7]MDM4766557.1 transporter substrate-binding domain-containing protein [Pelomonas sp. SE-A7]